MSAASLDEVRTDREPGSTRYRDEDFPGCESFPLPAGKLESYESRLEFWDGYTETAWKVCEPTSIEHEGPSRRLVQMATRFEILRGSRIACFGSSDLVRRDATGRKRWLMQADEVLYLHPDRVRLQGPAIDVDADPLPDVVLEVDHTTTCAVASSASTWRAGSRRSGCWCRGRHRCAGRGSRFTCAGAAGIGRSGRAVRFRGGGRRRSFGR